LFGVLADIFTLQGVYSIPSLVGLASILAHYLMQFLWSGVSALLTDVYDLAMTAPPATSSLVSSATSFIGPVAPKRLFGNTAAQARLDAPKRTFGTSNAAGGFKKGGAMSAWAGCEIYGFEGLKSPYAPQGLVVTATIFWYYLLDLLMNRNILDSTATFVAFPLFFGLQVMQLKSCDNMVGSVGIKSLIALVEGLIFGGTGYGFVQSYAPNRLPSSLIPQGPSMSSMTKNEDGTYTAPNGGIYIMGPDGRAIPQSFFTAAAVATTAQEKAAAAKASLFGPASATSCASGAAATTTAAAAAAAAAPVIPAAGTLNSPCSQNSDCGTGFRCKEGKCKATP
jgi:hypothetical protein